MTLCLRIIFFLSCGSLAVAQDSAVQRSAASSYERSGSFRSDQAQQPDRHEARLPAQEPAGLQDKQAFQQPLAWRFPELPAEEPRFPPEFELKPPVPADSVTVQCGENSVRVEAKKDLLGIGKPILPSDITLGGCGATGEDAEGQALIFESELHGCGSQMMMSEDSLIYVFTLHYTPSLLGNSPIVRTREVTVSVECHYLRKHDVISGAVNPTWVPYDANKASEENLLFSLKLMTDDWQFARPSSRFLLGDVMKFEASVEQFHHAPLQVFVDSCVATLIPNPNTVPRYSFLGNHGCLVDSQLTGSSSHFLPRTQDDKLQFQIEAFRFQQDHSGSMYITCHLRAAVAVPVSATNKACSFSSNRWSEASGSHQVCSCCEMDCGSGTGSQSTGPGQWEQETSVGPITVKERPLR
ncbi:zona pellucida sperm-binding protein 3-like [Centroberyx gerrardi]